MIEQALFTLLSAHTGVQAQFGSPPRIYADQAADGAAYPLTTFFRVDSQPISGIRQDSDWVEMRLQLTVYAQTRLAARTAANQIKAALQRIRTTSAGHYIDDTVLVQERDSFAADPHPAGFSAVELDYQVIYQEI